jgi:hypothetical protein
MGAEVRVQRYGCRGTGAEVREYVEEQAWDRFLIPAQLSAMVLVSLNAEVHDNNRIETFCT